jgi:hypothetical protein
VIGHLHAVWSDVWANALTPSVWTLLAIVVSHMLHRKAMATKMDKLRAEATETEKRLHDRIRHLTGRTIAPDPGHLTDQQEREG